MSDEVVSLFSLMESHLSRTKLNEDSTENDATDTTLSGSSILLPTPPGPRIVLPKFFSGNSPMKEFLAEQISNTLKAKEKRKQEEEEQKRVEEEMKLLKMEKLKLEEEMRKLKIKEEQEYLIDLSAAIIPRPKLSHASQMVNKGGISKKNPGAKTRVPQIHTKKLFDKETCLYKPWDPTLPCTTDMSYIIKNVHRAKGSKFSKVLCSRVRLVYSLSSPFIVEEVDTSNVVRFDFKSKSPGDLHKEYLAEQRKPKMSTRCTWDIMDFI